MRKMNKKILCRIIQTKCQNEYGIRGFFILTRDLKAVVHHTLTGGSTVTGTVSEAMGLWDNALWTSSTIPL